MQVQPIEIYSISYYCQEFLIGRKTKKQSNDQIVFYPDFRVWNNPLVASEVVHTIYLLSF